MKIKLLPLIIKSLLLSHRIVQITYYISKALRIKNSDRLTIGSILEKNALKFADKTALLFENRTYSHREFNSRVNQFAHYFLSRNIQKGETVVLFIQNRIEVLFIVGALSKIGAVASIINPNQRNQTLIHSINIDCKKHIIVGEELVAYFEDVRLVLDMKAPELHWLVNLEIYECPQGYRDMEFMVNAQSGSNPSQTPTIRSGQQFAHIFTSGTTGFPKAAIQTHRKWMQLYYWFGKVNLNLSEEDVIYVPIPFYHSNALMVAWASSAASGAAMAVRRKFSTSNFWTDIEKFKASSFIYIGELCRYLINQPQSAIDKRNGVKKIIGNGLRPEIWIPFKERFEIKKVVEFYASADGNIAFTNTFNFDCTVGWSPAKYALIKYDVEEERPYINNLGHCIRAGKGETGLLLSNINSKTPLLGYVRSNENKNKIMRNVFRSNDSWFNTGDLMKPLGYRHLQFVDRIGDTFRWKGENVSTTEVEQIVNNYQDIIMSAVYGVKIPHTDGRAGMVALQTAMNWSKIEIQGFYNYLKKELPQYAIPIFIRFCTQFEITPTQKIKKYNLKSESFNIDIVSDEIYVVLPNENKFTRIDAHIHKAIHANHYKF